MNGRSSIPTVTIAEDHLLVRDLLRSLCVRNFGATIVSETGSGREAIDAIVHFEPSLLLLDLQLEDASGFAVIDAAQKMVKPPRILVLSAHCSPYTVIRVGRSCAAGFIDKRRISIAICQAAIAAVMRGELYFCESFRTCQHACRKNIFPFWKVVTNREWAIMEMVGDGLNDAEIGVLMEISGRTVEAHCGNMRRKLGFVSRPELERFARDMGFTQGVVRSDGRPSVTTVC